MTNTNTSTINWFVTAGTLRSAFEQETREDGSKFWALTEAGRDTEELVEFVRDLHDDELPNDWRYETIVHIIDAVIDCDLEELDVAYGIADNLTDIYNSDLLQWYVENPGRIAYIEDAQIAGLFTEQLDVIARLTIGQNECIRHMVERIIDKVK